MKKGKMLSVKLEEELLDKFRKKSKETGITQAFVIRKAIKEFIS